MNKLVIFNPSIEAGGVERNLEMIANHLCKKFKKRIYLISYDSTLKLDKSINIIEPVLQFKIKNRIFKYLVCIISLIKFYTKNKHFVIFSFQANVYAIFIARILNQKIIIRVNAAPDKWITNYKKIVLKYFYRMADKIIVNSYEFKKEVSKILNVDSKVIYNPINREKIIKLSKKKSYLPFFDNFKQGIKILNIGRLTFQKNQIDLLKTINILKEKMPIRLLIVGNGKEKISLKKYIYKKKLSKHVKILPYTKNPYIYFKKANIFILTSIYEGLPNVLLEATLLKLLAISYKCKSGPKEILKNGKGGILVDIYNYKKIASEILKYHLSKNKKTYKKMITYSYKNIKNYEIKKQLTKYEDLVSFYLK